MSPGDTVLALLLTAAAMALLGLSKNPEVPRGNVVLIELCMGLVSVVASVFWLRVFALTWG